MNQKLEISQERIQVLSECIQNYDVGREQDEWPNNILSKQTIVYNDGTISKRNKPLDHTINSDELELCQKLSLEIANLMQNTEVGMGSNSGDYFQNFYIAQSQIAATQHITPELIRDYFADTIFPLATITSEPLTINTTWWQEVEQDGEESSPDMISWFKAQKDFIACSFVRIGDAGLLEKINSDDYPQGTIITGCVLPRLVLGLTKNGSLCGLFGFVVHS
ncbi:hypothetical protein [Acinetobacter defluvii]|uniref:hypothetical protein n=1 Tax=Acinetobacter defluvii TaxID=1871111 RepID=UPI003AF623A7